MQMISVLSLSLLGVAFINGWTDAPDAIAASIASGALKARSAARIAAIGNLVGAGIGAFLFPAIAVQSSRFLSANVDHAALSAILLTVILWAAAARCFGIPTSESHALPAAMTGASLAHRCVTFPAVTEILSAAKEAGWGRLLIAICFSAAAGAVGGFFFCRLLHRLAISERRALDIQRTLALLSSLLHGALDVPKFALLLGTIYGFSADAPPFFCSLLCGIAVALGCRTCGRKMIDHLTREVTLPAPIASASADIGASVCVLAALLTGIPLGTTQIRTAALAGACIAGQNRIEKRGLLWIALAWILTIPCCAVLAFFLTRLFS